MSEPQTLAGERTREVLGLLGFLLVATAQVSNMILARGLAGSVPPFSIAFFRWCIVALGLLPAVVIALREKPDLLPVDGFAAGDKREQQHDNRRQRHDQREVNGRCGDPGEIDRAAAE